MLYYLGFGLESLPSYIVAPVLVFTLLLHISLSDFEPALSCPSSRDSVKCGNTVELAPRVFLHV